MALTFNANKEVTSKLGFKPQESINNLCLGKLEAVRVKTREVAKVKENGEESSWEYAGYTIPSLQIDFKQHNVPYDRYFRHTEQIIVGVQNDGNSVDEKKLQGLYDSMWARIKHIYDAYEGTPNYVPLLESGNVLKSIEALYAASVKDTKTRVEAFVNFFTEVANAFNSVAGDKPVYVDAKGEGYVMVMKLVAYYKTHKFLAFPTYVGKGFIERARWAKNKLGVTELITMIDFNADESVELRSSKSPVRSQSDAPGGSSSEEIDPEVAALLRQ